MTETVVTKVWEVVTDQNWLVIMAVVFGAVAVFFFGRSWYHTYIANQAMKHFQKKSSKSGRTINDDVSSHHFLIETK